MPLGLDPEQTTDVWLESDKDKPEAARPTFQFYYLTVRNLRKVQELRALAAKEDDNDKCDALICEAIRIGLAGWRNMVGRDGKPIPYSGDINDVCTMEERWELLNTYPSKVIASESQKANFPSPSPSPSTGSAPASAETAASAPTSPASGNP